MRLMGILIGAGLIVGSFAQTLHAAAIWLQGSSGVPAAPLHSLSDFLDPVNSFAAGVLWMKVSYTEKSVADIRKSLQEIRTALMSHVIPSFHKPE